LHLLNTLHFCSERPVIIRTIQYIRLQE
jgi:hypothetical protein